MLACKSPPGNHESHLSMALYVRWAMPDYTRSWPSII
jgi:hypothetical protein